MSRGTGRVSSDYIDKESKNRPGYKYDSRTMKWVKDPDFKGGSGYNPTTSEGLLAKKKVKEDPTEMQFTPQTPQKLKIKKKGGKRQFTARQSVGLNQNTLGLKSSFQVGVV